jgi:hypothetical protein
MRSNVQFKLSWFIEYQLSIFLQRRDYHIRGYVLELHPDCP